MRRLPPLLAALLIVATACGGDDAAGGTDAEVSCEAPEVDGDSRLTIYSGRQEELVGPLLEEFADGSGLGVDVLYGDSADLARQLDEEGDASPADIFFSQAPGPLGFLDAGGRFQPLPADVLDRVPARYRAADGDWVGVSGRVRVLVFDPDRTPEADLPDSVFELAMPAWEGRVGVAPTNASFQDFVSYLRQTEGDDATAEFLRGLADNGARIYPNNVTIVEAVGRGEIDVGLVNHYYNLELRAQDPALSTVNHFFPAGDPGSLLLLSGVGILDTADDAAPAEAFVSYLLSDCAQDYFVGQTKEYPLVPGIASIADQPGLDELGAADADLAELGAQFPTTLALIEDSGLQG